MGGGSFVMGGLRNFLVFYEGKKEKHPRFREKNPRSLQSVFKKGIQQRGIRYNFT